MKLMGNSIEESNKSGVAVVHVNNMEDLLTPEKVREVEPEHWITDTVQLPALTVVQVLEQDDKRKEVILTILGTGNAFICHSNAKASAAARGSVTDGAFVAAPFSQKLSGTAGLWIVAASGATTMTASTWQSRRQ